MSSSTNLGGIANADLVTAGGRGHLLQTTADSTAQLDLQVTSDSATAIGMLVNNDPTAAGDKVTYIFEGVATGKAGEAINPNQEVIALTDSEFGAYVIGSGATVIGRYIPTIEGGDSDLEACVAGQDIRVFLYADKRPRNDASGTVKITYDFAVDGGVISSIGTGVFLPDNAVVYLSSIEVLTTATSGTDAATIAITSTDVTVDAALAISDGTNPWDAGLRIGDHTATASTWEKTTARQEISFVIAVEALTAGKIVAYLDYRVSE